MQKYILGLFLLATSFMSLDSANREIFKSYNDTIKYLLKINKKRQDNARGAGDYSGRLEEIIDCIELIAEKNPELGLPTEFINIHFLKQAVVKTEHEFQADDITTYHKNLAEEEAIINRILARLNTTQDLITAAEQLPKKALDLPPFVPVKKRKQNLDFDRAAKERALDAWFNNKIIYLENVFYERNRREPQNSILLSDAINALQTIAHIEQYLPGEYNPYELLLLLVSNVQATEMARNTPDERSYESYEQIIIGFIKHIAACYTQAYDSAPKTDKGEKSIPQERLFLPDEDPELSMQLKMFALFRESKRFCDQVSDAAEVFASGGATLNNFFVFLEQSLNDSLDQEQLGSIDAVLDTMIKQLRASSYATELTAIIEQSLAQMQYIIEPNEEYPITIPAKIQNDTACPTLLTAASVRDNNYQRLNGIQQTLLCKLSALKQLAVENYGLWEHMYARCDDTLIMQHLSEINNLFEKLRLELIPKPSTVKEKHTAIANTKQALNILLGIN